MIFSGDLCDKVLAGTKTQTRRPMRTDAMGLVPCQYRPGHTYAIQRKRGTHGLGPRIRVLNVESVLVGAISQEDAVAEGFADRAEFLARWIMFYGDIYGRCWRLEFTLDSDLASATADAPNNFSGSLYEGKT